MITNENYNLKNVGYYQGCQQCFLNIEVKEEYKCKLDIAIKALEYISESHVCPLGMKRAKEALKKLKQKQGL